MSLFFGHSPSVEGEFALKNPPNKGGSDTVLLSSQLWAYLFTPQDSRVLVLISSGDSTTPLLSYQDSEYLTCWANEDPDIECIAVPPHWPDLYPHIFGSFNGRRKLHVSRAEDISLSEVVLTAQTSDAYSFALSHSSALEKWLFHSSLIIRTGEELHLPRTLVLSNGDAPEALPSAVCSYRYKINATYPYSQGIVECNVTQFVVTSFDEGVEIGGGPSTVGAPDVEQPWPNIMVPMKPPQRTRISGLNQFRERLQMSLTTMSLCTCAHLIFAGLASSMETGLS